MNSKTACAVMLALLLPMVACKAQTMAAPEPAPAHQRIETIHTPEVGGIKQVIEVRSDDIGKPILLFLSGGPGSSMMNQAERFTSALRQEFTIVQWDQRDAGKTLKLNPSPVAPTLAQMESDALEVIRFLRKTYAKDKIYLLGSSWGNVLGFHIVREHLELLHAYFAVNPVVSQLASEQELLDTLKREFRAHPQASTELATVRIPFVRDEDLFYLRKWLFHKEGKAFATSEAFRSNFLQWSKVWSPVWNEVMKIDLPTTLDKVAVPVYFMVGANDIQTSTRITTDYFSRLQAPEKALTLFAHSRHQIHQDEPDRFQQTIIRAVQPALHSK